MVKKDKELVDELKRRLLKEGVKRLMVFGSRARGDSSEGSDLDVIALVAERTPEVERRLSDVVYDVMWQYDFNPIISLKVFSESHFQEALDKGFSFYRHVVRDSVAV